MSIPYDSPWIQTLGRLHIVVLHFPLGLFAVAALLILWSFLKRSDPDDNNLKSIPGLWLVGLATASAIITVSTGWLYAGGEFPDARGDLNLHRWLGVAVAVLAIVAYITGLIGSKAKFPKARNLYIALVLLIAPLVGFTGHIGGELVHGKNFVFKPLIQMLSPTPIPNEQQQSQTLDQVGVEEITPETPVVSLEEPKPLLAGPDVKLETPANESDQQDSLMQSVSFEQDVFPILDYHCIRCHNIEKSRGRVRLDDLDHVLQVIEPGDPNKSLIVHAIELPESDEESMPKNKASLSNSQIQIIRAWIASTESQ